MAVEPFLRELAAKHGLYLDVKGPRAARRGRSKVTWLDQYDNAHDLDFVLERNGSDEQQGTPVAFIETAWRRYTKHSRNKAQEIHGAVAPIREKYRAAAPLAGVVLAGEFTADSLLQLERLGFQLLHISYAHVVVAFARYGIDASSDETTPDAEFIRKIATWKQLPAARRKQLAADLANCDRRAVRDFITVIESAITRFVERVRVLPLHGEVRELNCIANAVDFVSRYREQARVGGFMKYEIEIRYSNGDKVLAEFSGKGVAVDFLKSYQDHFKPG